MTSAPPRVCRTALTNFIRHVDTHNRVVEESECWKQYNLKQRLAPNPLPRSRDQSREPATKSDDRGAERRRATPPTPGSSGAHMDRAEEVQSRSYAGREEGRATYWMRELYKAEAAAGTERWGHSGYKDLYPHDFDDTQQQQQETGSSSDNDSSNSRGKKKKKKKSSKKRHHSDDSDDDAECVSTKSKRLKKSRHKEYKEMKKKNKKKAKTKSHKRDRTESEDAGSRQRKKKRKKIKDFY